VFTTPLVIATLVAATLGAAIGFQLSHLKTRPTINRLHAELADAAWQLTHDPLTGLHNRTGLRTIHAATAASGEPEPIVAMLIDLDLFKEVNDTHGHDAGDDLLKAAADRIGQLAAIFGGHAARLSGDEFAAIMPLGRHRVTGLAEQFTTVIAEPVRVRPANRTGTVAVTASLGVAVVSSTDPLEDITLRRADTAMYHAKRAGGNQHILYTPGMTMPDRKPYTPGTVTPDRRSRRGPRPRDLRRDHGGSTA
jgi:diguanylate cyclase (GGDEF)-like protein